MERNEENRKTLAELEEELIAIEQEEENVFERLEESRKSWKLVSKILLMELIGLAILIGILAGTYRWKNDPARIAKAYVQGSEQGEWNDIYDTLYFGDGDDQFLSKKMFVSAQSLAYDSSSIVRVKINEVKETGKKGRNNRTIGVIYSKNGEKLEKSVPMIRKGGRWRVDGEAQYIKKDVKMEVPKDAAVFFDKIALNQNLKTTTEENRDLYVIPKVFDGVHYLALEKENMEKHENLIRFKEDETIQIFMKYNQEILEQAARQAHTDIMQGYQNAAAKSKSGRTLIGLKLTQNRITSKVPDETTGLIEVRVDSDYEYRFREKKRFLRRQKTERGKCRSICVYSYDSGTLKLEKQELNTSFL